MYDNDIVIELLHNQPPEGSYLYRYVTIDKLLDFLLCGRIPLIRLSEFTDKLEGVKLNHLLLNSVSQNIGQNTSESIGELVKAIGTNYFPKRVDNFLQQRKQFQEKNYSSCWYLNNYESVAMWQLYSNPDSVAIRIAYSDLSNEILNKNFKLPEFDYAGIKLGCVKYYNFSDIGEIVTILNNNNVQGFVKDLSFQHEQEFRIILRTQENERLRTERINMIRKANDSRIRGIDPKVIYMDFDNFTKMNFEIIFHPQACPWHMESIKSIITKFSLPFKTHNSKLKDIFN
jgi:hypothetical protein